ncbi:DUF721 domain-containing protein [Patescibacteria group bacterium]|nr:DUF721 domain-containing protein [Patescibacteria group bacterium]MBU1721985.1 DUF721 domain-containing protein [Patescibacteria group bacterium]MBU1901266.1 DUF721 domain-containing protein [Patescibacteria group bacterium]
MGFTSVNDTLGKKMDTDSALKTQLEAAEVVKISTKVFVDIFGEKSAAQIKPLFLKNRTLTVTCGSSAIAQEIRLKQAEIVEKMNKVLGGNEVDRIRYLL